MSQIVARFAHWKKLGLDWLAARARGPYAIYWLAGIAFIEPSFSPIPPDLILMAMLVAGAPRWRYYALVATLFSVLGSIVAYLIGAVFYDWIGLPLVAFYHFEQEIATVGKLFSQHAFWSMFTASFTPIPDKVFTLAAGIFRLDIFTMIAGIGLGRGLRFFLVSWLVKIYGPRLGAAFYRYFNWLSVAAIALGIVVIIWLWR